MFFPGRGTLVGLLILSEFKTAEGDYRGSEVVKVDKGVVGGVVMHYCE